MKEPIDIIEHAHYEPAVNQAYRILFRVGGGWRPLFWFKVGGDGSVYTGSSQGKPSYIKKGAVMPANGTITVRYNDGAMIDPKGTNNPTKTSFHASGAINSVSGRSYRETLRDSQKEQWLCVRTFKHPNTIKRIVQDSSIRPTDICLNYPVDDERPLECHFYLGNTSTHKQVNNPGSKYQLNLCFDYKDIEWDSGSNEHSRGDVTLQIILCHKVEGVWPPCNYMIFPALNDDVV